MPLTVPMRRLALAGLGFIASAATAFARTAFATTASVMTAAPPTAFAVVPPAPAAPPHQTVTQAAPAPALAVTIPPVGIPSPPPPAVARAVPTPPAGAVSTPLPHSMLASIKFAAQVADIDSAARAELDRVVQNSKGMKGVELRAYAAGRDPVEARKIALARALTVRSYLVDQGVKMRIEVGAFASNAAGSDSERVDIVAP
jgi:outer membrane protein OmpA-like peptidoglycan-associated protein